MKVPHIPDADRAWLSQFFSNRNALKWADVIDGNVGDDSAATIIPWLSLLSRGDQTVPVILPVFDDAGPAMWYACAENGRSAEQLREELSSFLGPSYTAFTGQLHSLNASDPIENALQSRFGRWVYQISPIRRDYTRPILRVLQIYTGLIARRPPVLERRIRPVGRIRADFDRAILAGDENQANELLEELRQTGRFDAENQKFIEVRLLAGLGMWQNIAHNQPLLSALSDLSLPSQTLNDVVEALYRVYVVPSEDKRSVDRAISSFREIASRYPRLFHTRRGLRRPHVLKAFLLFELCQPKPNAVLCGAIARDFPRDETDPSFFDALLAQVRDETSGNELIAQANQAFLQESYSIALELYLSAPLTAETVRGCLRCALAIDSFEAVQAAFERYAVTPDAVRRELGATGAAHIEKLTRRKSELDTTHPANWIAWARWIVSGAKLADAISAGREGLSHWSVHPFTVDETLTNSLISLLGNAEQPASQIFREAFPILYEAFVVLPERSSPVLKSLHIFLLQMIVWNDSHTQDELELATQLAAIVLKNAPSASEYRELVKDLKDLLSHNTAIANLDWALDTAELLAFHPSPDPEILVLFLADVLALLKKYRHRLTAGQISVLQLLVKDFEWPEVASEFQTSFEAQLKADQETFAGTIGICTLTEQAALRARDALERLLPRARVELNHDHVATSKLEHLARTADLLVFAWRSSKHQAYECVRSARRGRQILMPAGKGTASIVRSVMNELG
jgi:hypothetical protein